MKRTAIIAASLAGLATLAAAGCSADDTTETAEACPVVVAKTGDTLTFAASLSDPDDLDSPAQYDDYAARDCVLLTGEYLNSDERAPRTTSTWAPADYAADEDEQVCLRRLSAPAGLAVIERVPCPDEGEGS